MILIVQLKIRVNYRQVLAPAFESNYRAIYIIYNHHIQSYTTISYEKFMEKILVILPVADRDCGFDLPNFAPFSRWNIRVADV